MASLHVCDPVAVPLSVLEELQQLRAALAQLRKDNDRLRRDNHPLQTSDATGAAASQVGPDAQAAVVLLNKHAGLSYGKIAQVLTAFFGITLTRGACTQIVLRAGERLQPAHEEIRRHLAESEQIT